MADPFDIFPDAPVELRIKSEAAAGRFAQPRLQPGGDPFDQFPDAPVSAMDQARQQIASEPDLGAKPLAFGLPIVGPYLEEGAAGIAALPNLVTGGAVGPTYDQSLARMRARNERADRDYPIANLVGQTITGLVTGGALLSKMPLAKSYPGRVVQGSVVGGGTGAIEGFGLGEGDLNQRMQSAETGAKWGAGVGGAIPAVAPLVAPVVGRIADAVSPTLARWRANMPGGGGREMQPRSAGAAAAPPMMMPPVNGADAAAEQVIANQLARANVNTTDIRQRLAQARQASIGQPNATALADLDPSLARLGGSVQRQQPEAGNIARSFIQGRQTGITPRNGMPASTGIPTRGMMEAPAPNAPPMGQSERVRTALREALDIPAGSSYRNEQAMIAAARQEAQDLYGDAYRAASGIDVRPAIQPVLDRWLQRAADEPREISRAIIQAVRLYQAPSGTVGTLQRFQRSKEFLDGKIENYMESLTGRNRAMGGMLGDMQRELLRSVDQLPNAGTRYNAARQAFSTRAEMREAIDLGRAAARESPEVSAAQYQALTVGQQRMFRMGLFGELERRIAATPRQNDVTRIFDTPQMQELLQVVAPQGTAPRVGQFIQGEKNYLTGTRNEVMGNSKTAERLADDEATNQMQGLVETLRSTRSLREAAFNTTQAILDKIFGFRADTAASIARQLFTANPRDLDGILLRLENRLGPNRAEQFRSLMQQYANSVSQQAAAAATSNIPPAPRQQPPQRPQQNDLFSRPPGYLPPDPKPRREQP
jgi:hypothetical protein